MQRFPAMSIDEIAMAFERTVDHDFDLVSDHISLSEYVEALAYIYQFIIKKDNFFLKV